MGGISQEIIEKVRQSVDIVDVIGEYVSLKRAGAYHKALSPFQKEKTPSFMVSPQRQSFKCYSSGHGGDVFKFIMLHEHLDFPSAVRKLADKAGIEIPEDDYQRKGPSKASRESLYKLHNQLTLHWRDILLSDKRGQIARDYLKKRNIPDSWIKEFGLGFAPDSQTATMDWAKKNNFTSKQLIDAGVVTSPEGGGRSYDRFRGRLIFPIKDESGRIVGFSGRIMQENKKIAKYINSPETAIFIKGKLLFGLDRAKKAILDSESVIICEGQIDVLRCHSEGILNVVAPLGTAFTSDHCRILKRFTDRMILCLDSDRAGQASAARLGEMLAEDRENSVLSESDFGIQVIQLPEGHDPDSLITKEGADAFRALLLNPVDFLDFYITHLLSKEKHDTPSARRRVVEAVARLISKIKNAIVRDHIIAHGANKLGLAPSILNDEVGRILNRKTSSIYNSENKNSVEKVPPLVPHPLVKDAILLTLADATLIPEIQRQLQTGWISDLSGASLLEKMIETYNQGTWTSLNELYPHVDAAEQNFLSGLVGDELDALVELSDKERSENIVRLIKHMEIDSLNRKIVTLGQQLKNLSGSAEQQQKWAERLAKLAAKKNLLVKNLKQAN